MEHIGLGAISNQFDTKFTPDMSSPKILPSPSSAHIADSDDGTMQTSIWPGKRIEDVAGNPPALLGLPQNTGHQ